MSKPDAFPIIGRLLGHSYRKSTTKFEKIEDRGCAVFGRIPWHTRQMQLLRYRDGQKYSDHTDGLISEKEMAEKRL